MPLRFIDAHRSKRDSKQLFHFFMCNGVHVRQFISDMTKQIKLMVFFCGDVQSALSDDADEHAEF